MRLEVYPNLTGMAGTERTIAHMRRLVELGKVDPAVVLQAHKIVKGIDRNNWLKMASVIFKFVHDHVSYVRDPVGVEFVKAPGITLKTLTGDCDDQAVLFSTLAESIGLKTRFKAIKADPRYPKEFSHVYSQALIPKRGWMTADTIVPRAKFGWEAKNFPGKTWKGMNGMNGLNGTTFIDRSQANKLGDAVFANGVVGYDDDDDDTEMGGTAFGETFGDSGGMWDSEPLLAKSNEKINTIVDADDDLWGGATDTPPGPGFVSRMLPPGVGTLEGDDLDAEFDDHAAMGASWFKWNPKKDLQRLGKNLQKIAEKVIPKPLRDLHQSITKPFRDIGKEIDKFGGDISKAWKVNLKTLDKDIGHAWDVNTKTLEKDLKNVGNTLARGIGLSTPETRQRASEQTVNAAFEQVWGKNSTQFALELLRRANDLVESVKAGRMPKYIKSAPPGIQRLAVEQSVASHSGAAGMGFYPQAIMASANLVQGIGVAEDQKAARKALKKYVGGYPYDRLGDALQAVTTDFIAAGGMLPAVNPKDVDDSKVGKLIKPTPEDWGVKWAMEKARKGKEKGETGWRYHDMWALLNGLEAAVVPLKASRKLLSTAYKSYLKLYGGQAITAAARVVKRALEAGAIKASEITAALAVVRKKAEGLALTPQEMELAARIAKGARKKQGAGKGVLIAIPVAAAAGAALLL